MSLIFGCFFLPYWNLSSPPCELHFPLASQWPSPLPHLCVQPPRLSPVLCSGSPSSCRLGACVLLPEPSQSHYISEFLLALTGGLLLAASWLFVSKQTVNPHPCDGNKTPNGEGYFHFIVCYFTTLSGKHEIQWMFLNWNKHNLKDAFSIRKPSSKALWKKCF